MLTSATREGNERLHYPINFQRKARSRREMSLELRNGDGHDCPRRCWRTRGGKYDRREPKITGSSPVSGRVTRSRCSNGISGNYVNGPKSDSPWYPVRDSTQPHIHSNPWGYVARAHLFTWTRYKYPGSLYAGTWPFSLIHLAVIVRFMETVPLETVTAFRRRDGGTDRQTGWKKRSGVTETWGPMYTQWIRRAEKESVKGKRKLIYSMWEKRSSEGMRWIKNDSSVLWSFERVFWN